MNIVMHYILLDTTSDLYISSFMLDEHAVMDIMQSNVKAICISGLFFIESKW